MARRRSKLEKPKLPDLYRKFLESDDYRLQVKITILGYFDSLDNRLTGHPVTGKIQIVFPHPDPNEDGELDPIDVGLIEAWRTVSQSDGDVEYWADQIDQGVYDAFNWLLNERDEDNRELALLHPALFIECVEIDPMWRGLGLALPAVATFLDVVACRVVFFKPDPAGGNDMEPQELEWTRLQLRQYWQKLWFEHYDEQHNYMWTEEWGSPAWLRQKDLF